MENMIYRYELAFDGEIQDFGFLQGMMDLDLDDDESNELIGNINKNLPYPNVPMRNTRSFFTKKGNKFFQKDIRELINAYEERSGYEIMLGTLNLDEIKSESIVYADEFQVLLKADSKEFASRRFVS